MKTALLLPDNEDVVVHIYKVRIGGDYYKIMACGNKYLIERYLKHELKTDLCVWEKSKLTNANAISKFCKGNKIIARDSFLVKMEFLYMLGTKRSNPLANTDKKKGEEQIILNIDYSEVEQAVHSQEYSLDSKQRRVQQRIENDLKAVELYESYKDNPEQILLEKERKDFVERFVGLLKAELSPTDMAYISEYMIFSNNASEASRKLGVSHTTIIDALGRAKKKALQLLEDMGMEVGDLKEYFRPNISNFHTQSASSVGYPSESYMKLPARRTWTLRFGSERFTTKKTCLMPEFLKASNCKCICNICNNDYKCTRKDAFPENAEPVALKINAIKINECINNLIANYKLEELANLERMQGIFWQTITNQKNLHKAKIKIKKEC